MPIATGVVQPHGIATLIAFEREAAERGRAAAEHVAADLSLAGHQWMSARITV
jgi:hypothetical protein